RFRYATDPNFEKDFSYAISETGARGYSMLKVEENEKAYIITTSKISIHISKVNIHVTIYDKDDNVVCKDDWGFHWEQSHQYGGNIV
ncbi:DUF4968 domain-containing protein, partial [Aquimarina celericrescens]|nr:DUF4968 domain-containing protein [Aquimarina celericrescens]